MMTSGDMASMYAQIVNGGVKEKSRFVTDEESSALWDTISGEVEQMRRDNPDVVFSIPNEMPDTDEVPDTPAAAGPPAPAPGTPPADATDAESASEDAPEQPGTENTPADQPDRGATA